VDIKQLHSVTKNFNVLCVEDDETSRNILKKFFSNIFGSVDCVENGEEAWQKWQQKRYDLLVTDLTMPKMGGVELIQKIRSIDPYAHIIVLTAHNDKKELIDSINLHVDGFLLKPLDLHHFSELLAKVAHEINIKKSLEEYQQRLQTLQDEYKQIASSSLEEEISIVQFESFILQHKESFVALLLVVNNLALLIDYFGVEVYEKLLQKLRATFKDMSPFKFFWLRSNEFVFLAPSKQQKALKDFAQNINSLCLEIEGAMFRIRFSKGWAEGEGEQLLKDIEKILLLIAQSGKVTISFIQRSEDFSLLKKVSEIIKKESIKYALQPIVDKNFHTFGYELLCRLEGEVDCKKVVEVAKVAGILHKVTIKILQKAHKEHKENLFVNVTKEELICQEFYNYLQNLPSIVLEFSPLVILDEEAKMALKRLKQRGHKFCFANIGKDPYSIQDLADRRFMPDFIKFDLEIVKNALHNPIYRQLLISYSAFAKVLGVKTIALGVESKELLELLQQAKIDYFQGYYTGRPR